MATAEFLMPTYNRLPVRFKDGEGVWLRDEHGTQYLDAISGIAVCGLGHAHPSVRDAICAQASSLLHTSNLYGIQNQEDLAAELCRLSGMRRVFFGNSGAEANEAAIKLARLYGHEKGIESPSIIVMDGSFHGRTLATLSATGNRKVQAGFEPLVQGFVRVPYDDVEAIRTVAGNSDNVVAILVEPVQGEGGIRIPSADYLASLRAICDANDWLLMLDEIQTGIGRTGHWFAFQHTAIKPDVMTLAKALGNGVPIGACLADGAAAEVLQPGTHGSTFGGNPLACRAALAVLQTIDEQQLCKQAQKIGHRLLTGFRDRLENLPGIREIRGLGLMLGIELEQPCAELVKQALEQKHLLINVTADNVIRLLPPLITTEAEADRICDDVTDLIAEFVPEYA